MSLEYGRTYVEVVIDGEDRAFDLEEHPTCSIGRSPQNTVALVADPLVSRKHALIRRELSGQYYLTDLGSRNGTTHNGKPITAPVLLRDGDKFTTGGHSFLFRDTSALVREETMMEAPTDVLVVQRMITILVLDIRNYTVLARELGESRISEIMNKLFNDSGALLKRKESWAQKFIGDAVMAFWVHGEQKGTKEIDLVLEALVEMTAVVRDINAAYALPWPMTFGAGVNTGMAVTGNMGSAGVSDHTAMGDAVNKAFRLESASKEIGRDVVIGRSTYDMMSIPEPARRLFTNHTVHLKGYDQPEEVHGLGLDQLPLLAEALRS